MKRLLVVETIEKIGEPVKLAGWVHQRRDHGQIIFIDLRDQSGLVQIVFSPQNKALYQAADSLRPEWVISIEGKVNQRPKNMANTNIPTGEVEISGSAKGKISKTFLGKEKGI